MLLLEVALLIVRSICRRDAVVVKVEGDSFLEELAAMLQLLRRIP